MEKLCVVRRKESKTGKILTILIWALSAAAFIGGFFYWPLLLLGAALVAVNLIGAFSLPVCYDYTFFGSELKIARIKGDNRRKLLHEINMENVEVITGADDLSLGGYEGVSGIIKKDYTSGAGINKVYKMIYKDSKQIYMFDIEPSPEFLDALSEKYGRIIKK